MGILNLAVVIPQVLNFLRATSFESQTVRGFVHGYSIFAGFKLSMAHTFLIF
jgi:hypothetical protein